MNEVLVVFTPDSEPFLGHASVYRFDLVITRDLADNGKVAAFTRERELTPLQRAVSEIISQQGINLALSKTASGRRLTQQVSAPIRGRREQAADKHI